MQGGPAPAQQGGVPQSTGMPPAGGMPQPGGMQAQRGREPGAARMRPVRVEDIVETDVVTCERDTPVATVVAQMAEEDVGSVVVVEDDEPVGIITDRSIALALENTPDVASKQAGDLIGGDLVTATTSMTVFDALRQMSDEGIRRLPIVDEDGSLEGIISLDDILVLLGSELNRVGETVEQQSPRL